MKKRVVISGVTGMLGSMVYNILQKECKLILIYRNSAYLSLLNKTYGGVKNHKTLSFDFFGLYNEYANSNDFKPQKKSLNKLVEKIGEVDAFINCAGVIKPNIHKNHTEAFFINSAVPHILSRIYKDKLIHLTTDCVFSGQKGSPYDENSVRTPNDLYGLSKSIGEPTESLVFRSSIFGPEIHSFTSLYNWVGRQKNADIFGFTNHFWNGLTTKQLAKIYLEIVQNRKKYPKNGVYHIFSNDITKYEMVKKIAKKLKISVTIRPKKVSKIDRRLTSIYSLCKTLNIPSFDQMLAEL